MGSGPYYHRGVFVPPADGADWIALTDVPLDVAIATEWVGRAGCGATVIFSGTVRDHAEGATGVTHIDYEAWSEQVVPRLEALAGEVRARWPEVGRIVLWHREGRVELGASSVIIAVSTPHRGEAFAATQFAIDRLKSTVPIWKKEFHDGGSQWARSAQHIEAIGDIASSEGVGA